MIQVFSCSEAGGHPVNEDAFAIQSHPEEADSRLVVVADGQGGRAGGLAAARLACATFMESASRLPLLHLQLAATWGPLLHTVDRVVCDDPSAGFTSLVALLIHGQYLRGASCGDSAAAVVRAKAADQILTKHQRKNPPVGSGEAVFVDFVSKLTSPWSVLAMTDGVWKYSGWDFILQTARGNHGAAIIEALRNRARLERSGQFQDDFTLVVLQE